MRDELIQRVQLQYMYRHFHIHSILNEVDFRVINLLVKLSIDSVYAVVRKECQTQLFSILSHFPYSSLLVVPKIASMLNKSSEKEITHDQLKGCLYLLRGNSVQESIMIKPNWKVLGIIWPAIFKCQHYEKPSIQTLLDKINFKTNKEFDSFDNRVEFSANAVDSAYELDDSLRAQSETRLVTFKRRSANDNAIIASVISKLVKISRESQLLWKNQATSFGTIMYLISSCENEKSLLTEECVQLIIDSLVSENIKVRRVKINLNTIIK